jgi:hypothetical protein
MLLLFSVLVGALSLFLLGLGAAFGPEGLGGDGSLTSAEVARAHFGQRAGTVGAVVPLGAGVVFVARPRYPWRPVVLASLLIVQIIAGAICVWSMS